MTASNRLPDPVIIEHVVEVLASLSALLDRFGEPARATWFRERRAVLAQAGAQSGDIANAVQELHGVVLGMGGLMDLHLTAGSPSETAEVNAELERLADQLFELTR